MARVLAIDYGKKRTGLAASDELQIIANGIGTVATVDLIDFLLDYVKKEPVERIVVGLPKQILWHIMTNVSHRFSRIRQYWRRV